MRYVIMLCCCITLVACSGYGEKVTYDGTDVHYTQDDLKSKAEATGAYLEEIGFTDGDPKSVQITRDSVYHFRMVVQDGIAEDPSMEVSFKALGMLLSEKVFEGEPIHFDLCDDTFTTLKTVPIRTSENPSS